MSQQNLEVVHRAISAINERDVDAYLSVCTPDFELINPIAAIEGPNRGEEGVRSFFEGISEAASSSWRSSASSHSGATAFWLGSPCTWKPKGGHLQRQPITNLYEIEDGRLSRVRVFFDRAEALEAAGLSE